MESIQRNTAFKIWISDLLKGIYTKGTEQFESGYALINGLKISRVNLVGGVIDKFTNENSISFNLDDGSGLLRLRSWNDNVNLFNDINIGDLVLVVGKVKEYNNSIYVTPEIINKLNNPLWLKVRKLELIKKYGEVVRAEETKDNDDLDYNPPEEMNFNVVEEKINNAENTQESIISLIEKMDSGDGVDADEIVKIAGPDVRVLINELLMSGEIFEFRKGRLRVIG